MLVPPTIANLKFFRSASRNTVVAIDEKSKLARLIFECRKKFVSRHIHAPSQNQKSTAVTSAASAATIGYENGFTKLTSVVGADDDPFIIP